MREETMGNQNTSGIVADEGSRGDSKEESKKVSGDDEIKDFQEKDCHDDHGGDRSPPDVKEEANGFVNGCETRRDSDDGTAKLGDEAHDQPCTKEGEIQGSEMESERDSPSNTVNSSSVPHEVVDIAPEPQNDQNGTAPVSLEVESLGPVNSSRIEEEEQLVETCVYTEEIGRGIAADSIKDVVTKTDVNGLSGNAEKDEFLNVDEEKLIGDEPQNMIKLAEEESAVGIDSVSCVESVVLIGEVVENETMNEATEMGGPVLMAEEQEDEWTDKTVLGNENNIESETKCLPGNTGVVECENTDEAVFSETRSHAALASYSPPVPQEAKISSTVDESQEIERVVENENNDSALTSQTSSRAALASCSPLLPPEADLPTAGNEDHEIKRMVEYDNTDVIVISESSSGSSLTSCLPLDPQGAEIPTTGDESREIPSAESSSSHTGARVELRKSPSFDFGLSARCEESDQTPLLYQDKTTAMRRLSSCSGMRFQNRSVQTEYLGPNTRYEAVEVQEKTITMERSCSESLRIPSPNSAAQENGSTESPSREGNDIISLRGNRKRKPRSSLLTTCICCTTAIS